MKYLLKGAPGVMVLRIRDAQGAIHKMEDNGIVLTAAEIGEEGFLLGNPAFICTPIIEKAEIVVEPEGNPADVTQSEEIADPMPDFEPAQAQVPRSGKKRGKRR